MEDRECTVPGCQRERTSRVHCKVHHQQWKQRGEVWPIGDKAHASARKRAAWALLSDEEKAARIAPMIAGTKGKPRSALHSQRISESLRARRAAGDGYVFEDRACRGCEETFTPNSGQHWYCGKECQLARRRLKDHGLTNRDYLNMLEAQGGVCALCKTVGRGFGGGRYELVIDHCHDTGIVRGILCPECNTALGRFGDDAGKLRAAADYIERTCPH